MNERTNERYESKKRSIYRVSVWRWRSVVIVVVVVVVFFVLFVMRSRPLINGGVGSVTLIPVYINCERGKQEWKELFPVLNFTFFFARRVASIHSLDNIYIVSKTVRAGDYN